MVAYEIGIKEGKKQGHASEREFLLRAVDLNATSNDIGRFIYLDDLNDAIRELDAERQETKLP
jgi:hypothetical protein